MNGKPNEKINVKLTLVDEQGVSGWHMDIENQGEGGAKKYPPAKVKHGTGADFKFSIIGKDTQKVTFANINPIWIKPGEEGDCPTSPGIVTDQIKDVCGGGTKVLTFTDLNCGSAIDLVYQLNFNNAPPLDPIIRNTGGGGGGNNEHLQFVTMALIGIGALGAVALAGLWARNRPR